MNYAELKKEIQEIVKIAQSVPEEFRNKCFEVLLGRWIDSSESHQVPGQDSGCADRVEAGDTASSGLRPIPNHTAIAAFTQKTQVTKNDLVKVLYIDKSGIVQFYNDPSATGMAEGVINWALLQALRNAVTNKFFEVDPEELRSVCQEKGCYDPKQTGNFWRTLSQDKNKRLFNGVLKANGEPKRLTPDGQDKLAELLRSMMGNQS